MAAKEKEDIGHKISSKRLVFKLNKKSLQSLGKHLLIYRHCPKVSKSLTVWGLFGKMKQQGSEALRASSGPISAEVALPVSVWDRTERARGQFQGHVYWLTWFSPLIQDEPQPLSPLRGVS